MFGGIRNIKMKRKTDYQIMLDEFEYKWKKNKFNFIKKIPKNISEKEGKGMINDLYLIKDEKGKLIISGGGKILLWIVYIGGGWRKHLENLRKKRDYSHLLELLKFRFREKLYGINLIKRITKDNYMELIDNNIEGEILR